MKKVKILSIIILSFLLSICLYAQKATDKCIFENKEESDLWKSDTCGCKRVRATLGNQVVKNHDCLTGKSYSYLLNELGTADHTHVKGNLMYLEYYILPSKKCFKNGQGPKLAEIEVLQVTVDNATKMIVSASVMMS